MDLRSTIEDCRRHPDQQIVVATPDEQRTRTFGQLADDIELAVARLARSGIGPGSRVGLLAPNGYAWIVHDLALAALEAVSVAFPEEWSFRSIEDLRVEFGLHAHLTYARLWREGARPGWVGFLDRDDAAIESATPASSTSEDPDIYSYAFSSGTSGAIKCLLMSRAGAGDLVEQVFGPDAYRLYPQDSFLVFLPLSNYQQRFMVYGCLRHGARIIITTAPKLVDAFREFRPTIFLGPPVFYDSLASKSPDEARALLGSQARLLITGMAPIRQTTLETFAAWGLPLIEAYGLTETGPIAGNLPETNRPGSVGKPFPGVTVRLADDGEILVSKRYLLAKGYRVTDGRASGIDGTDVFLPDGNTVATGDIGRIDEDGYLHLTGRKKDIIITRGGHKLHPQQVEATLAGGDPGVERIIITADKDASLLAVVWLTADDDASRQRVRARVDTWNASHPGAHIHRTIFTDVPFTMESGFLTRNLKPDRNRIANHFVSSPSRPDAASSVRADPSSGDALDLLIDKCWQHVLGTDAGEDFFQAGGDSMALMFLAVEIEQATGVSIDLEQFMVTPTRSALRRLVEGGDTIDNVQAFRQDLYEAAQIALPSDPASARPSQSPEASASGAVLLTGATGYLGGHLLATLLEKTDRQVICLVRGLSTNDARDRLRRVASFAFEDRYAGRLEVIAGNLAVPDLGMQKDDLAGLVSRLCGIYHVAATVNFASPYTLLRRANVLGTIEMLRLAAAAGGIPINFVSTLSTLWPAYGEPRAEAFESMPARSPDELPGGYAQSKAVAEAILADAASRGFSVRIFRPGEILANQPDGEVHDSVFTRYVQSALVTGVLPDVDIAMPVATVGSVAQAIVRIAEGADSPYARFHLADPRPITTDDIVRAVAALGVSVTAIPYDDWLARVAADSEHPVFPLWPYFRRIPPRALQSPDFFDEATRGRAAVERWSDEDVGVWVKSLRRRHHHAPWIARGGDASSGGSMTNRRIKEANDFLDFAMVKFSAMRKELSSQLRPRCSRCIVSDAFVKIENGVCDLCLNYTATVKDVSAKQRLAAELDQLLDSYQGKGAGAYDAMVLFSGGKDSSYLVHQLRHRFGGLRLLAVTLDNGFMSEVALHNARQVLGRIDGVDHITVRPHRDLYKNMFRFSLTNLREGGCYHCVDRLDGDLSFDIARRMAAKMKIPLVLIGISDTQAEMFYGLTDSFESPRSFETARRTAAGQNGQYLLRELSTEADLDYWWDGSAFPASEVPRVIYPLCAWDYDEDFVRNEVKRLGLISEGNDNPLVTNNDIIPVILAVDVAKLGYSTFEPEFAQLVREGRADRTAWLNFWQSLEYLSSIGYFMPDSVDETLARLDLTRAAVGIGERTGPSPF